MISDPSLGKGDDAEPTPSLAKAIGVGVGCAAVTPVYFGALGRPLVLIAVMSAWAFVSGLSLCLLYRRGIRIGFTDWWRSDGRWYHAAALLAWFIGTVILIQTLK